MANGPCTHALPIRVTDSPLSLTAGGMTTPAPLGAAILSLADGKRTPLLTGLPGYRPIVMRLAWADMTTPVLTRDDWDWLAQRLVNLPTKRLHIHCQAGHGRTGTALAILCTLWGAVPDGEDPVTWVRAQYCDKAVETQGQLDYVARITGRLVTAAPAMPAYTLPPIGSAYAGAPGAWTGQTRTRDLYADPYARDDYFGTRDDRDLPPLRRDRDDRPAPRRRKDDDSIGARRERLARYLPDVSRPDRPGTETHVPIEKRPVGDPPKARFPVRYPKIDGPTQGADGAVTEAPPERAPEPKAGG